MNTNFNVSELSVNELSELLKIAKKSVIEKKSAEREAKKAERQALKENGRYVVVDGQWTNCLIENDSKEFSIKYVQDNEFSGHYDVKNAENAPDIIPVSFSKGKNSIIKRMGYSLIIDETGKTLGNYVRVKITK